MIILLAQQPHVLTTTAIRSGTTIFNQEYNIKLTYAAHVVLLMLIGACLHTHIGTEQYLLVL